MASGNEDGDLIDLGNDACVPRVTVDDPTPEEQEHLLDVCPPKLEQKLSLTKRQERVLESADKGDVLVTLGHDQVVPVRKRIDVVSSDTIKRVRDITRNLEPVIRRTCKTGGIGEEGGEQSRRSADTVDYGSVRRESGRRRGARHEDETYEAREISNAFNFLAEHDDNEDQAETSFGYRTRSAAVAEMKGGQLDNPAFESSSSVPSSRESRESSPNGRERAVVGLERRGETDAAVRRERKRRSFQRPHRKSWTEGTTSSGSADAPPTGIDRSNSLGKHRCAQSMARDAVSGFLTRYERFFRPF